MKLKYIFNTIAVAAVTMFTACTDNDYTELDKAEEGAKALNKDNYVDFTAVEKALEAIDRTKNLTQQSDVDKMAKDINDAVAALVYKDADYTELDKAEEAAKADKIISLVKTFRPRK